MKSLAEVLQEFKKNHSQNDSANLADIMAQIAQDSDIKSFWQDNQPVLRPDAFEVKLMDLYEYVQQKNRLAAGQAGLYPGYYPHLALEKGYPHVEYVASQAMQERLNQQVKLTVYQVPKSVQTADLNQIAAESGQEAGRGDALAETVRVFRSFVQGSDSYVPGLYLAGDFGVGKTYMMGALANALAANGIDVMLLHFPSFISNLKASFNKPNQSLNDLLDQAKTVQVLILDDIGADTLTAWSRDDILGIILEYRMQNELTTCFTSNFDMASLQSYLAQTRDGQEPVKAARLMQRIQYLARPVTIAGRNRRLTP